MNIITAPHDLYDLETAHAPSLFLAGGITNCPDWQSAMIEELRCQSVCADLTIYNPRRTDFDIKNPRASEEQICWEFAKLRDADIVSFWFAPGSVNPIVFYELGMWGNSREGRPMCVGCDHEFTRIPDVVMQTRLARPELSVQSSLSALVDQVVAAVFRLERPRPRITDQPVHCTQCGWHGNAGMADADDEGRLLCQNCSARLGP